MNDFFGKCVLVTGANSGIGLSTTKKLLTMGSKVIALDVDLNNLDSIESINQNNFLKKKVDVTDWDNLKNIICLGEEVLGPVQKLVCSAAIIETGPVLDFSYQKWKKIFEVNLNGIFNTCKIIAKKMVEKNIKGSIVNISSNSATMPRKFMSAYSCSKAAVTHFTKCLGLELAEHNIRCNTVSPGSTDTPMQDLFRKNTLGSLDKIISGSLSEYRIGIPLKKIASVNEISDAIIFLLSEQSSHITMHDLLVDGGATLGR